MSWALKDEFPKGKKRVKRITGRGNCKKVKVHGLFRQSRVAQEEQEKREVAKDDAEEVRGKIVKGPLYRHTDWNLTL